jgi:hypothetical protein
VSRPELDEIVLSDPPRAWVELGFSVDADDVISLGAVRIRLGAPGSGIVGLTLRGLDDGHDLDGLPMHASSAEPPAQASHPIGARAVDHVVALTPDLDRTTAKLIAAGFDHRATRGGRAFFVLGPCLLELGGPAGDHAHLWGLTLVVDDLDRAAELLGGRLKEPKQAVQPGRRIATVRSREAGLTTALALMTPR